MNHADIERIVQKWAWKGGVTVEELLRSAISSAISRERERCEAVVNEEMKIIRLTQSMSEGYAISTCENILAAIRKEERE